MRRHAPVFHVPARNLGQGFDEKLAVTVRDVNSERMTAQPSGARTQVFRTAGRRSGYLPLRKFNFTVTLTVKTFCLVPIAGDRSRKLSPSTTHIASIYRHRISRLSS